MNLATLNESFPFSKQRFDFLKSCSSGGFLEPLSISFHCLWTGTRQDIFSDSYTTFLLALTIYFSTDIKY